jgi:transposase
MVWLDESGFQFDPVVRRTYAPRGETPVQEAWHRKGKVSAISAVTVSPVLKRLNLVFRLLPDGRNAHGEDTVAFLAQLRGRIRGPMTVVWDQSKIHQRSGVVRAYLAKHPEVVTEDLPGYAPDANPDEGVWGWAKYHRLPNYAPEDTRSFGSGSGRSSPPWRTARTCWPRSSATPASHSTCNPCRFGRAGLRNVSRCPAGRLSWTLGCLTSISPMPVWMARPGRWPLPTTCRRPASSLRRAWSSIQAATSASTASANSRLAPPRRMSVNTSRLPGRGTVRVSVW